VALNVVKRNNRNLGAIAITSYKPVTNTSDNFWLAWQ
jgi:hypothetical protein